MNEKQMSKLLLIIAFVTAIIFTLINLKILDHILYLKNHEIISDKITAVFSIFVLSYSLTLFIVPKLLNIVEAIYVRKNEKYNNDIKIEYYRELIEKYSIGALVKCYGKKVKYNDLLVAILLRLAINKKIEIQNGKINVLSEENLSPSEYMFIKACKGCRTYTKRNIRNLLEEDKINDALETDLFSKNMASSSRAEWYPLSFGLVLWILNFFAIILSPIIYKNNEFIVMLCFISHFLVIFSLFFVTSRKIIYRTEKGKETQHKLYGLNRFLRDYSNINNRKIEEIKIWDEYIIYAIIFNFKGILNIEAYKTYKEYIRKIIV